MLYSFCSGTSDFQFFSCLECLMLTKCEVIKTQAEVSCMCHVNVKHKNCYCIFGDEY